MHEKKIDEKTSSGIKSIINYEVHAKSLVRNFLHKSLLFNTQSKNFRSEQFVLTIKEDF